MAQSNTKTAALENMQRSYEFKHEGLELKLKTMRLLHQKVELLEKKAQTCEGEELLRILEVMAALGQAIVPD